MGVKLQQNITKVLQFIPYYFLLAVVIACAPVISPEVLKTVDQTITFEQILKNPDAYKGKTILLGGTIIKTTNLPEETLIELVQQPLSRRNMPHNPEASKGRFLILFKEFKDPAIYSAGRLITVVGEVIGSQARPLGETNYKYPLISPTEYYLWKPSEGPSVHIGIGVGTTF
ncbi:MAG: Slp family lipoprotein [Deltaproteobacteria bacterium]|nr:Slp family lipoprotein [Deltaproteobacteria bacterium]